MAKAEASLVGSSVSEPKRDRSGKAANGTTMNVKHRSRKACEATDRHQPQNQGSTKDPIDNARITGLIRDTADKAKSIRQAQISKAAKKKAEEEKKAKDRDPTLDWHPYPRLPGLPEVSCESLPNPEGSPFQTTNNANDFIEAVKRAVNVELGTIKSPQRQNKPFRVVVHLSGLPASLLAEPYQHIQRIVGVGTQMRVRAAETLAKLDLAERLYRVLQDAENYLPMACRRVLSKSRTHYLPISLSPELRQRLVQTNRLLNETGIFQTCPHTDDGATGPVLKKNRHDFFTALPRKFTPLPKETIRALVPPKRDSVRLPIYNIFHRIVESIEHNNVTVLSAATGSGKTTQLPQYILDYYLQTKAHFDRPPSVLVTQPRRIAAKTVAQRIADEREQMQPGGAQAVGYSVRFESRPPTVLRDGSILFCTAGVLLKRLQREPDLASITHLVLDEVHERDVFTDILLLVSRNLLKQRPELRLILMSATMDAGKFVNYFKEKGFRVGTVLDVEGTNFPVSDLYLEDILQKFDIKLDHLSPESQEYLRTEFASDRTQAGTLIVQEDTLKEVPLDLMAGLMQRIILTKPPGAILVFLPGWEEITQLHQLLQARLCSQLAEGAVEYHLLHSTSPLGASDEAFKRPPPGVRKVILATNLAESSITIPDVVYVIDSGKQKVMHYDQRLRMNVLEPCWISKANLRQRLGRAGRCQPGEYYGLLSRARSQQLPEQTLPELLRLGLDEVCLNLKAMGLTHAAGRILDTAIDPPERGAVRAAIERLCQIGAIDEGENLTPLGRLLANLPLHPAMGKMLVTASIFGCVSPILSTVGLLGQKLFRPIRSAEEKYDLHAFYHRMIPNCNSDHLLAHKIFTSWKNTNGRGGSLPESLLSYEALFSRVAFKRLEESRRQILRELHGSFPLPPGMHGEDTHADNDELVRLILASGFYPEVAIGDGKRNQLRLRKIPSASSVPSSVNYLLGTGVIKTALERRGLRRDPHNLAYRTIGSSYFIYEELFDLGQKLVAKTTAVDPLMFILFARAFRFRYYLPPPTKVQSETAQIKVHLTIDGWITFRGQSEADLRLLTELRVHWNEFIQFVIYKQLGGETFSENELQAMSFFRETILALVSECDVGREQQGEALVECDRHGRPLNEADKNNSDVVGDGPNLTRASASSLPPASFSLSGSSLEDELDGAGALIGDAWERQEPPPPIRLVHDA